MTKPLSMDIRERAMARLDAGGTVRAVADALSIAPSSVVKWSERRRTTGSVAPGKIGGHVPRKIGANMRIGCGPGCRMVPSPCADWWPNWPSVASRSTTARCGAFAHAEGLSFKRNRARQ
jgi:hypothetical protein